ncbi:glycosyltransferase family 4 protein [Limnobacter thiooxidans]|uniref:Glycosyltransferase family 4 protein n=2 Tax=Burkholderiaceae TaxID=119060 RepID=A0AA86J4V7_9BURK|nr:glycosyltransferase family 4 protein [Limnobacter thiooxidans]
MIGSRRNYAVSRILSSNGLLDSLVTDFYIKKRVGFFIRIIDIFFGNRDWFRRLKTRRSEDLNDDLVSSINVIGLCYALARRLINTERAKHKLYLLMSVAISFVVRFKVGYSRDVYWGIDGDSFHTFSQIRRKNHRAILILEQTILPRRMHSKVLMDQGLKWPAWRQGNESFEFDSGILKREQSEWDLSDYIFTGSTFVRDALIECGVSRQKIRVVPYGVNEFPAKVKKFSSGRQPLRLLFVGEVGLRKGVPYLLHAVSTFQKSDVVLTCVGKISVENTILDKFRSNVTFTGSIPRSEVSKIYESADVFILPSLIEGSSVSTYEALAHGLPVITTKNSGSIVEHMVTGQIVDESNVDSIIDAINIYLGDRSLLESHSAQCRAYKSPFISRYKDELIDTYLNVIGGA